MIVPKKPLYDGVALNAQHPDSFFIPSEARRNQLNLGASVKIGCSGERFWVEVKKVILSEDGLSYVVRVDNDLVMDDHGLKFNDLIEIEPRHVLAVYA